MLTLSGITKIHNEGRPNAVIALADITLTLPKTGVTVVKGPSGSGKSTLLALIGCLARPTSGRITLDDEPLSGLPDRFMTQVRRQTFGFVFQRFNLIAGLSALDNVLAPTRPFGLPYGQVKARAMDLLDQLGLAHRAGFPVDLLSGGEMQRVAVARALINDPAILIADEPTANLDSALSRQFLGLVAAMKAEGRGILLSSHDPRVCDAPLVDRVVTLQDGRLTGETA